MKRRSLLIAGGGSLVLAGLGVWSLDPLRFRSGPAPAPVQLEELALALVGTSEVGREFLARQPGVDPKRLLMARLNLGQDESISQETLIERLEVSIREDFEAGRILTAESGWLLAETEVWLAALQVSVMGEGAPPAPAIGFASSRIAEFMQVEDYVPRGFTVGEALQHPGLPDNVMWFSAAAPAHIQLYVDDVRILPTVNPNGFSARFPESLLQSLSARPGTHPIWAYEPAAQRRQIIGHLAVFDPQSSEAGFCRVIAWGEQETRAGLAFNPQPDGSSALWIRIDCAPQDTVVMFGGHALPTTVRATEGLITARVDPPDLYARPGDQTVRLVSESMQDEVDVGVFSILP